MKNLFDQQGHPLVTKEIDLSLVNSHFSFVISNSSLSQLHFAIRISLLDILNHLANSLDRGFDFNDVFGNFGVVCFGADRVGFP